MRLLLFLMLSSLTISYAQVKKTTTGTKSGYEKWVLQPFIKQDADNPCLEPLATTTFDCPVRKETVTWEEKDVFNPAAIVRNGKVYLLYRAEDKVGKHAGTSRIGLAVSEDGVHFTREPKPVFYPDNDAMKVYEWEGGCEDPRVIEDEKGTYYMTYTAYDGTLARLCVASSPDLVRWTKHGLAFAQAGESYKDLWSKSGSIVCRRVGNRIIATKLNGLYYMYWGDTKLFVATSKDLIHWTPLKKSNGELAFALEPRPGKFDSDLVEPGPPALLTADGILLLYNSRNKETGGDPDLPSFTYAAGQVLFDPKNPEKVLQRSDRHFMHPDKDYEINGQVGNVCFVEGMVYHKNKWFLYYGTADSKIAVAVHEPSKLK
ncbi:glycosidase [Rhodocytophaga rosea]|uniref:Glycosidase n=1 Tax=Rhodocytophaga rosea TaxID=2704465 RepID=A0A6C0GPW3_9BACT|nr:glycoside hydrolase family 130 protein [Rhodocytophaga rosea]QHT70108.1 glycosidase [Rhodocytophaga rosea]